MASFNKVILMGNLTRDPQLKYLPSQTAVTEFGLACNRKFKTQAGEDKEEVTFVDCTAFGRTGEVINQYFTKGKPIFIEGRLKYDQWEDKQGGDGAGHHAFDPQHRRHVSDRRGHHDQRVRRRPRGPAGGCRPGLRRTDRLARQFFGRLTGVLGREIRGGLAALLAVGDDPFEEVFEDRGLHGQW